MISEKYYLGKLCKRGHRYKNTKNSLRHKCNSSCVVCHSINTKRWKKEHSEWKRNWERNWRKKNPEKKAKWDKRYFQNNKEKILTQYKKYRQKIKLEVFSHYSNGEPKCANCGELDIRVLSIDHIGGGGNKHLKEIGCGNGYNFYLWLRRNNYPSGFRVLCLNCNWFFAFKGGKVNARIHKPECECCGEKRVEVLVLNKKQNKTLCQNCHHTLKWYSSYPHQKRIEIIT